MIYFLFLLTFKQIVVLAVVTYGLIKCLKMAYKRTRSKTKSFEDLHIQTIDVTVNLTATKAELRNEILCLKRQMNRLIEMNTNFLHATEAQKKTIEGMEKDRRSRQKYTDSLQKSNENLSHRFETINKRNSSLESKVNTLENQLQLSQRKVHQTMLEKHQRNSRKIKEQEQALASCQLRIAKLEESNRSLRTGMGRLRESYRKTLRVKEERHQLTVNGLVALNDSTVKRLQENNRDTSEMLNKAIQHIAHINQMGLTFLLADTAGRNTPLAIEGTMQEQIDPSPTVDDGYHPRDCSEAEGNCEARTSTEDTH